MSLKETPRKVPVTWKWIDVMMTGDVNVTDGLAVLQRLQDLPWRVRHHAPDSCASGLTTGLIDPAKTGLQAVGNSRDDCAKITTNGVDFDNLDTAGHSLLYSRCCQAKGILLTVEKLTTDASCPATVTHSACRSCQANCKT